MNLKVQKRLAAQILGCSPKKVVFSEDRLDDIKQAITKRDLKLLMGDNAITMLAPKHTSRFRARKQHVQKAKGLRKGEGTRKGHPNARLSEKLLWMRKVRIQREFLKMLKDKNIITAQAYRLLYLKSKGGYFRSRTHIKIFLQEHDEMLVKKTR